MKKPNFFILGAPKCGTTWLYHYLSMHPQVFMPSAKEPHYFNTDSNFCRTRKLEEYESLFQYVSDRHKAIGEASVWYLYSRVAVVNILRYQPEARFIVMVRNPLTMAPSLHQQTFFNMGEDEPEFAKAWALQESRSTGRYLPPSCREPSYLQYQTVCSLGEQLARLIGTVERNRVHVVVHDDLSISASDVFLNTLRFLDLDSWLPPEQFGVVHSARRTKSRCLKRVVLRVATAKSRIGITRSFGILNRLQAWNKQPTTIRPVSPELRREMARVFNDDIRLLSELLSRPFDHWLNTKRGVADMPT